MPHDWKVYHDIALQDDPHSDAGTYSERSRKFSSGQATMLKALLQSLLLTVSIFLITLYPLFRKVVT